MAFTDSPQSLFVGTCGGGQVYADGDSLVRLLRNLPLGTAIWVMLVSISVAKNRGYTGRWFGMSKN